MTNTIWVRLPETMLRCLGFRSSNLQISTNSGDGNRVFREGSIPYTNYVSPIKILGKGDSFSTAHLSIVYGK